MGFDIILPLRGGNVTETQDFVIMTIRKIFEELEVAQFISSTGINYVQLQLGWMSSQNGYDGDTGDKFLDRTFRGSPHPNNNQLRTTFSREMNGIRNVSYDRSFYEAVWGVSTEPYD